MGGTLDMSDACDNDIEIGIGDISTAGCDPPSGMTSGMISIFSRISAASRAFFFL